MQRTVSPRRHGGRLAYAAGLAAVLLWTLLLMMGGLPAPAAAAGSTICVGPDGDYATIQAAIDAAQEGDTILLAGGTFTDNVVITKSLNMEGRWLSDCSGKDTTIKGATVVHPETGRAFTIVPDQPGISITVALTDLSAAGDATGLGGARRIEASAVVSFNVDNDRPLTVTLPALAVGSAALDWRAQVAELAAQGFIPGAPTAEQVQARLAGPQAAPEPQVGTMQASAAYNPAGVEVDCGGPLYAKGAGLRLERFGAGSSIASTTGAGYGGAVCIVDPSADGVAIANSQFNISRASWLEDGAGGAMFIQGGGAGDVTLEDIGFFYNTAAPRGAGLGGALAVVDTPHFKLSANESDCTFSTNTAGAAGNGLGGGVYLLRVPDAEISGCRFFGNYAGGGSAADPDANVQATVGLGGGLFAEESRRLVLEGNFFDFNVAQTAVPQYNRDGSGGGAFVANSSQVVIGNNTFDRNTAGYSGTGYGGGLAVIKGDGYQDTVTGTVVYSNTFTQNWATVVNFIGAAGGGFYAYGINDTAVTSNTFAANAANTMGEGGIQLMPSPYGGGVGLQHVTNAQVADNRFEGNVATVGGGGMGGGLGVRGGKKEVQSSGINIADNVFLRNLGDSALKGTATGGAISVAQGEAITVAHNQFVENSGQLTTDAAPARAGAAIMLTGINDTMAVANYVGLWDVVVDSNQILDSGKALSTTAAPPNNFALAVQAVDRFTVTNNVIAGSTLGGIVAVYESYLDDQDEPHETHGVIVNNTLYDNGTYGLWLLNRWRPDVLPVVNNIVADHKYGVEGINLYGAADPVLLDYTLLYGNEQAVGPEAEADGSITATHTIAAAPLFFSPARADYRLLPDSPAIDAGDPAGAPPAPPFDLDGAPRPYGPRVDIGAYEWQGQGYPFRFYLPEIQKQ